MTTTEGNDLSCPHCHEPVTEAERYSGRCPHCGELFPERKTELDKLDEEREHEIAREDRASLQRLSVALRNTAGLERLRAISDEEWQAAVEADASEEQEGRTPSRSRKLSKDRKKTSRRAPEEIEMVCPLCGHTRVMRYPYRSDGWQYVCQGCKCAFDPDLESL
jgi:predicted RNA-binding Zn-ribbon protein involved in translation (DUF1610 family)